MNYGDPPYVLVVINALPNSAHDDIDDNDNDDDDDDGDGDEQVRLQHVARSAEADRDTREDVQGGRRRAARLSAGLCRCRRSAILRTGACRNRGRSSALQALLRRKQKGRNVRWPRLQVPGTP